MTARESFVLGFLASAIRNNGVRLSHDEAFRAGFKAGVEYVACYGYLPPGISPDAAVSVAEAAFRARINVTAS